MHNRKIQYSCARGQLYCVKEMENMKNKIRRIRDGKLLIPCGWMEINPQHASEATHVAICVGGENVGVYYADREAGELTQEQITEIETRMVHGCDEINVYGLIDAEVMENTQIRNLHGVQLIRNVKEMTDNA